MADKKKSDDDDGVDPPEEKVDTGPPVVIDTRLLKSGDYELHIFIEETRGLVHPKDASSTVDPLIKVSAFDLNKHTTQKENRGVGMIFWGEHLFFEKKFESSQEFEVQKLHIQVMDHNALISDSLIGEFEIDLVSIYFSEKHAIQHQWVALSNMKKNFQEIKGFLKFSASCVGPGDEQVALEPEPFKKGDEKQLFGAGGVGQLGNGKVMLPPQIQTKGYQMIVKLIKAESLPKMDTMGSIDTYLLIEFGSALYKTKTVKNSLCPFWGYTVYIPFSEPTLNDLLTIKVYDWDRGTHDEIVGSACFSKRAIVDKKYKNFFWINLYGAQTGSVDETNAKIMNGNSNLGTFWKGRILLSIIAEPRENPILSDRKKQEPIEPQILNQYKISDNIRWKILIEVYYGLNFPVKDKKYGIQFRWADKEYNLEPKKGQNGVWEWYLRTSMECDFPYQSGEELPDVFVYITDDKERISYLRKDVKFCLSQMTADPQLFYFKPDKSKQPKMKDFDAGMVKMRFTVGIPDAFSDLSVGNWDKPIIKPMNKSGFLFANIYHAQDLIPADNDGNSDPFYTVSYYGVEDRSDVIDNSLNPVWYESKKLQIPCFELRQSPPIILNLYDDDPIGKDFLGSAIINVADGKKEGWIAFNSSNIPEPKWVDLKYNSNVNAGRILVSFNFFEEALPVKGLPSVYPVMEKYHLSIKILGLRNLKSLGLLPVKRPFIKFDINSMKARDQKQALAEKQTIQTQPKESGSDPNFATILTFEILLPKNYLYCPSLNCIVYDCIFKGLVQPVLGIFSINISEFIKVGQERNRKKLRKASEMFMSLKIPEGSLSFDPTGNKSQNMAGLLGIKIPGLAGKMALPQTEKKSEETKTEESKEEVKPDTVVVDIEGKSKKGGYTEFDQQKKLLEFPEKKVDPMTISLEDLSKKKKPNEKREVPSVIKETTGGIRSEFIVLKAKYYYNEEKKTALEEEIPDEKYYMPLGFDENKTRLIQLNKDSTELSSNPDAKKHYRYYVDKPLEESIFMDRNTDEFDIKRGKRVVEDSLFSSLMGADTKEKVVGKFKGWIEIISETDKQLLEKNALAKLAPGLKDKRSVSSRSVSTRKQKTFDINKEFLEKTNVIVRAYIISAHSLAQMDDDSMSDPYLRLKLGDQVQDNEKEYQNDQPNPEFYKMFEFKTSLPGASQLIIQAWDHDLLVKDDLIGETIIDLENRFFSRRWRKLDNLPIETRTLRSPISTTSRGRIKLWVEIIPVNYVDDIKMIWDIKPKPPAEYELRVVVWDVEDVPSNDIEDCSDLFVTGIVDNKKQKTDTHFRAQGGAGSFNWRMVWPLSLPMQDPSITFQIWDKDYFSPNDFISEATFDFKEQMIEAFETDNPIKIFGKKEIEITQKLQKGLDSAIDGAANAASGKKVGPEADSVKKTVVRQEEKFIIMLTNTKKAGYSKLSEIGKLQLSFELVPMSMAKNNKVGLGRSDPNHSPWLPPPVGRFEWSWNPITLFKRCVGPKARTKICICLCILLCTAICISFAPIIVGDLISAGINKI